MSQFLYSYCDTVWYGVLSYLFIKGSNDNWEGSIRAREEVKMLFANGQLVHTHPQLLQAIVSKIPALPPDKLRQVFVAYWLSPEEIGRAHV